MGGIVSIWTTMPYAKVSVNKPLHIPYNNPKQCIYLGFNVIAQYKAVQNWDMQAN